MSRARHKRAGTPSRARRVARIAVPVALITAAPVGAVATYTNPVEPATTFIADPPGLADLQRSTSDSSRSAQRVAPAPIESPSVEITASPEPLVQDTPTPEPSEEPSPEPTVDGYMFATAGLNVREGASTDFNVVTVVSFATELALTGVSEGEWVQVLVDDTLAWVHGDYLSEDEPQPDTSISYAPCPFGTGFESALTPDAIRVYRAVCARFTSVSSYGGYRSGGGEHSQGRAIDIMISSSGEGDQIAAWVRENHSTLGVSEVIWSQRIWTVERSSEGWRWMADRGSATANHYDHVHVTVYGNSGG